MIRKKVSEISQKKWLKFSAKNVDEIDLLHCTERGRGKQLSGPLRSD